MVSPPTPTRSRYRRNYIGESETFEADRERVLGCVRVHRDPAIAAEMLAEALGGQSAARDWLARAYEAVS